MIVLSKVKGAIFDADGTLLDSMWMWGRAETEYLISLGVTPRPDLEEVTRSIGGHEVFKYLQTEYGVRQTAEEMSSGIYKMMGEFYSNRVMPKAGAIPVLDELCARGVKLCVATATDRYLIEPGLRHCGLAGYFGRVFTCREESTSKNNPDIFIRAAGFLGTAVSETLVIEDALYAMRTAKSVGFPVAAVYDSASDDQWDEIKEFCDFSFETFNDMLEELRTARA